MSELTKAAAIEHQQSVIERVIEQRLMDMEDVPIDTGRKIFAQDVVEEMQDLNPDRFMAGVYLAVSATASNQYQGRGILQDLRREAVTVLIRRHGFHIYALAREAVESGQEVRHVA